MTAIQIICLPSTEQLLLVMSHVSYLLQPPHSKLGYRLEKYKLLFESVVQPTNHLRLSLFIGPASISIIP